ncbi:MAG: hypothetical protein M0C28_40245 [Candidatus Moduliflexus flocculans]|nr:hypothetical protein [Candidatus Moduliflexus flocculans]
MVAQPENWKKTKGYRSLALLQMYQGKYTAAQENLKQAVGLNKSMKGTLSEFRDRLFLATNFLKKGQIASFEKEMAAAEKIHAGAKIEPFFLARFGTLYARANRVREAGRILDALKSRFGDLLAVSGINRSDKGDQAAFYRLEGEIEMAKGLRRGPGIFRDDRGSAGEPARGRAGPGLSRKRGCRQGHRTVQGVPPQRRAGRRSPGALDPRPLPARAAARKEGRWGGGGEVLREVHRDLGGRRPGSSRSGGRQEATGRPTPVNSASWGRTSA